MCLLFIFKNNIQMIFMFMYRQIFNRVKKIIPKISNTELIALRTGTVSIDREIFQGKVNLEKRLKVD